MNTEPTVCFLNPAILPGWFWLPTAYHVQERGFSYVIPDLPRENPAVSMKANVDIVEDTLAEHDCQYIVALSRGVEYAVRYLDRLAKKDSLHKVAGWMVLSSVGPRGYESVAEAESLPMSRHTPSYARAISLDEQGLEQIDPAVAESTLLYDIRDEPLRAQTLSSLIQNRPLADSEISSVPILPKYILPLAWYIGVRDMVDNIELSTQVAHQKFGVTPKYAEWGHVAPLSHTEEVSDAIIEEVQRSIQIRRENN